MTLPISIRKRDGRLVPFEPEKISRALFAATEELGVPNAFLARELTDGILHFLNLESDCPELPADHIAELVSKVVRELGQPAIAKVFEEHCRPHAETPEPVRRRPASQPHANWTPPRSDPFTVLHLAAGELLNRFSRTEVYPRDLVSAHDDGLLSLFDLHHPNEISGTVWPLARPIPSDSDELTEAVMSARAVAGSFIAIDSPELVLAALDGDPEVAAARFLATLDRCALATGLRVILNLNILAPPPWARQPDPGPLFQNVGQAVARERVDRLADLLLRASRHTVYWHLSERDFLDEVKQRLHGALVTAHTGNNVEFVFDRPRQPVALGPGIDRRNPAALGCVGINLPRLVAQLGAKHSTPESYLTKLKSLARFGKSAGHARQDWLRKNGRSELQQGFLLEQAAHLIVPRGAIDAARSVLGDAADYETLIDLTRRSLQTIRQTLNADQPRSMATRLDLTGWPDKSDNRLHICSLGLSLQQEIRAAGQISEAAGGTGLLIPVNQSSASCVEYMEETLKLAMRLDLLGLLFVDFS